MEDRNRNTQINRNSRAGSSSGYRPAASYGNRQNTSRSRTATTRRRRRKKGLRRFSRYTRFLILYSAAFLLLIMIVAIILTAYLAKYEAGQPSHVVEAVMEDFRSEDRTKAFLKNNAGIITPDLEGMEDTFYPLIAGKDLSFVSDSQNSSLNRYSYLITADQLTVAALTLDKTGSDSWTLSGADLSFAYPDAKEYTILVPEGSTVTVGGNDLGPDKITGTGIPEVLAYSAQFLESSPTFTSYTVKSVSSQKPEVSGTDPSGQLLTFQVSDSMFVAERVSSVITDNVKARVEAGVEEYALYFECLAYNLREYMLEDCERYAFIFGSDEYDPINPELYMYEYIGSYDFQDFEVSDYIVYSEDCFTAEVSYDLLITFVHDGLYGYRDLPDDNPTMHATWVWVKDGDEWKVADIQDHL